MKTKLLKRLRREGRDMIHIHSVTTTTSWRGSIVTGMSYGYSSPEYAGLFSFGDTEEDVLNKAMRIYMEKEVQRRKLQREKSRRQKQ